MPRSLASFAINATASTLLLLALAPCSAQERPKRIAETKPSKLQCKLVEGRPQAKFIEDAASFQSGHFFYNELVDLYGIPSKCRGGLGQRTIDGQSWWIEFTWADGSKFIKRSDLPETSVAEYTRPDGLARADDLKNRARKYAAQMGLRIDWAAVPHIEKKGSYQVIEYADPDPGVNGFVRFTYDEKQRLVGVWVSMAL